MDKNEVLSDIDYLLKDSRTPKEYKTKYWNGTLLNCIKKEKLSAIQSATTNAWDEMCRQKATYGVHYAVLGAVCGAIAHVTLQDDFSQKQDKSGESVCMVVHADLFEEAVKLLLCTLIWKAGKAGTCRSLIIEPDKKSYLLLKDEEFLGILEKLAPGIRVQLMDPEPEPEGSSVSDAASEKLQEMPAEDEARKPVLEESSAISSEESVDPELIYKDAVNYQNGTDGKPKDLNRAFEMFRRSADMGYAPAQTAAAGCYISGDGTSQDFAKAKYYYELASIQDNAAAWNGLGLMYGKGIGMPKDVAKAFHLFEISLAAGYHEASENYLIAKNILKTEQA